MQDNQINKIIQAKGSLLCAVVSVLAAILLFTMDFSWFIVVICAAVSALGIFLAMKQMMEERPQLLLIISMIVCVLALIVTIVYVILTVNSPDTSFRMIDTLKDANIQ